MYFSPDMARFAAVDSLGVCCSLRNRFHREILRAVPADHMATDAFWIGVARRSTQFDALGRSLEVSTPGMARLLQTA